jgi:hypothetical protein
MPTLPEFPTDTSLAPTPSPAPSPAPTSAPIPAAVSPRVSGGFEPPAVKPAPSFGEVLGPAFTRENEIAAAIDLMRQEFSFEPEAGYSPFSDPEMKGRYIDEYGDRFVGVQSSKEARALRQRIDAELERAKLIESAGGWGIVASMAAGILSPTTLLPVGAIAKTGSLGVRMGRSAATVGAGAAAGVAAQEGMLQSMQLTRTAEESAYAIGGGAILGMVLGGAVAGVSGRMAARMERDFLGANPNPETRVIMPGQGARQSVGAAAVDDVDTTLVDRLGSGVLARLTAFMTPLLRMQTSDAAASRLGVARLADPAGARVGANVDGLAVVPGGSVEARSKTFVDAMLARYQREMDEIYMDYWKSVGGSEGVSGRVGIASNAARRAIVGGDGPLSPTEFFELVGRTRGLSPDEITDPLIRRAVDAQSRYQSEVFSHLPEELRPDISGGPRFAGWYLPRIFNAKAIAAKADEFVNTIFRNMKADQERKALLQGQVREQTAALREAERAARKLARRAETSQKRLADVEARIEEVMQAARRGDSRAAAAEMRLAEIENEILDLEAALGAGKADLGLSKTDLRALEKELSVLRRARDKALADAAKMPDPPPVAYDRAPGVNAARFVKYVQGERKPREPSFLQWIIKGGGVSDPSGEIANAFGGRPPKGLIARADESNAGFDDWATRYGEHVGKSSNDYEDDFLDFIYQAAGDKDFRPPDWRENYSPELRQRVEEFEAAQEVRMAMGQAGLDPNNKADIIAFLRGEDPNLPIGTRPGPGEFDELEYVPFDPERIRAPDGDPLPLDPIENFRGMDELTAATQGEVRKAERIIQTLRNKLQSREKVEARAKGAEGEAAVNARASRSRLDVLLDRAERIAAEDSRISDELSRLSKTQDVTRGKIEKIISEWEGDTARAAKSAIARRAEQEAERLEAVLAGRYQGAGGRLTGADREVDKAARAIRRSERGLIDSELLSQARSVVQNMMASPDGRLPYEWGSAAAKQARAGNAFSGDGELDVPFLKERKFPVPDDEMLDVMDNDIRRVFHAYVHSMIPQAEMQRMFGDVRGTNALREIQEEYSDLIAAATSEKERLALRQAMNSDIKDFNAMRDRILGVYGLPSDPESLFYRGSKLALQFNFMSKMGMMVVSSIADAGGIVLKHGLGRSFDALAEGLKRYSKDPAIAAEAKLYKNLFDDAGVAAEMVLGSRAMSFAEIATDYGRVSKFERGVQQGAAAFSYLNLARQWDTATQTIAAIASIRRIMRNVEEWLSTGNLASGEAEWMASINIGRNEAGRIWRAAQAGEGERVKGVLIPEGRTWSDPEAYEMVRVALKQTVDTTIVKPGQDKPLVASTPVGRLIFQFRSFIISSHQRILLSGLQQADANMAMGAATMLALGTLSIALRDLARDGQLKDRTPGEWFTDGFEYSGLPGWLMEPNNIAEKISGQQFGLRPLLGQEPATRTLNQSKADVVLGPSLGFLTDAIRIAGAPLRGEVTRGDTRAVRNQIPTQNLFWFRHVWNTVHDGVDQSLGIYEPPKKN